MNLYVRVGIGMVASMVLSVLAVRFIAVEGIKQREMRMASKFLSATGEALAEQLRDAPDREQRLEALSERWGLGLTLVPLADVRDKLASADGAHVEVDFDNFQALVAVDDAVALRISPPPEFRGHGLSAFLIALGVSLLIVIVTAVLIVLPIVRRLRSLEKATKRLRDGDLSARAEVAGGGAIGSLASNFNHMATDIERLVENQKQLLQAVSHEFRTPASRIRFSLEMLEGTQSADDRAKRLADIDENLTELDSLVDELLTYVRLDGASPELRTDILDVQEELSTISDAIVGVRDNVTVDMHAYDDAPRTAIIANRRYFRRVVENLVHNAIRHATSKVSIEYQTVGGDVVLLVHDDGPGVPREERKRVWEPFARLDTSRSRDSGGFGLGLSIVRRIMEWHGGEARVEESELGGAMFVTTWKADGDFVDDEAASTHNRTAANA